jgi:hypothetical protein
VDAGPAVSYKLLARGTPVHARDGQLVGTVDRVLENAREHIFDGIVITIGGGEIRFVDAPEVARITEQRVTLSLDAAAAEGLPDHEPGAPEYRADPGAGRVRRWLGGGWRRR